MKKKKKKKKNNLMFIVKKRICQDSLCKDPIYFPKRTKGSKLPESNYYLAHLPHNFDIFSFELSKLCKFLFLSNNCDT